MATAFLRADSARANVLAFPSVATDAHARRILRTSLTSAIAELVDLLDRLDGDADEEPDGDEQDGNCSEDDFMLHSDWDKPGCPIADPGGCEHDGRERDYDMVPEFGSDQTERFTFN